MRAWRIKSSSGTRLGGALTCSFLLVEGGISEATPSPTLVAE